MIIALAIVVGIAVVGTVIVLCHKPYNGTPETPVNHKGTPCIVSINQCTTGICTDCPIYREYLQNKTNKKG